MSRSAWTRLALYALAWLPMIPIAVLNGALRQGWYGQHLAELTAHQVSTATALVLLGVYMRAVIRRWPPRGAAEALAVGFLWLALTLAFEFLFGHFVAGHTWGRLLADYDLAAGRVWVLIPLWVGLAPWVFRPRRSAPWRSPPGDLEAGPDQAPAAESRVGQSV